jgi:hypothetical protein
MISSWSTHCPPRSIFLSSFHEAVTNLGYNIVAVTFGLFKDFRSNF